MTEMEPTKPVLTGNVRMLRALANAITESLTFDQSTWWHSDYDPPYPHPDLCGSPACLAGHLYEMLGMPDVGDLGWSELVEHYLDLPSELASSITNAVWGHRLQLNLFAGGYHRAADFAYVPSRSYGAEREPTSAEVALLLRAIADDVEASQT